MDGEPRRVSSDHHSRRPNGSISTIATARSADDREATELDPVHTVDAASSGNNSNAHSSRRILDSDLAPASCPQPAPQHWYHAIFRFWHHYIHLAVPHADCRDHLGIVSPLETFPYHRTTSNRHGSCCDAIYIACPGSLVCQM